MYQLLLSMAFGSIISLGLKKIGLTFPDSVGAMIAAAIIRNIADYSSNLKIKETEIRIMGDLSLMLFLALSMMNLKLWQIADLASSYGNIISCTNNINVFMCYIFNF